MLLFSSTLTRVFFSVRIFQDQRNDSKLEIIFLIAIDDDSKASCHTENDVEKKLFTLVSSQCHLFEDGSRLSILKLKTQGSTFCTYVYWIDWAFDF